MKPGNTMMPRAQGKMVAKLADAVKRLQLVAPVDWIKKIEAWRRHEPDNPNLSAAIRRLVEIGLAADAKAKAKDKKHK
jgi:hypothetical protein